MIRPGMRVRWNDPDKGPCSREGVVKSIVYHNDELVRITMEDGWEAEVCPWELEPVTTTGRAPIKGGSEKTKTK
jgi:hypothetical protein